MGQQWLQGIKEISRHVEDPYGHRTYKVTFLVVTNDPNILPATVALCPGLPIVGSYYAYGEDVDVWAICHPEQDIHQVVTSEQNFVWEVTSTFSTKPIIRCQDTPISNPLNEPPLISGTFVKYTKEVGWDVFGAPLMYSSREPMRGSIVERDFNRPTIEIRMNLPLLLDQWVAMVDCQNSAPIWGFAPGTVKLSNMPWQKLYWGVCNFYYQVTFQFDINFNGFNSIIPDIGTKKLSAGGDVCNILSYETLRSATTGDALGPVPLNGQGLPVTCTSTTLTDTRQYLGTDADGNYVPNPNFGLPLPNPNYIPGSPSTSPYYTSPFLLIPNAIPYFWNKQLYYAADLNLLPVPPTLTG